MSKKPIAQVQIEGRVKLASKITDAIAGIIIKAVPWAGAFGITYLFRDAIEALAGKVTHAEITIQILEHLTFSLFQQEHTTELVEGVVILALLWYSLRERRLRKDTIERLHNRIEYLELKLDPNRTSSRLTSRGETNPEDLP